MVNEAYQADLQRLYKAKNESDIDAVLDFCALLEEDSEECMSYLISMFFFWHADKSFDLVTPLRTAKDCIKKMYQDGIRKKIEYMQKHSEYYKTEQINRIQNIENQFSELEIKDEFARN